MTKQPTVIYHKSDFDGIFCREIAKKFLPNPILIGWEYGETTPEVPPDAPLYILDLSVGPLMTHPHLVWIDHHKTAIEQHGPGSPEFSWKGDRHAYCIDGVAACRLAYQWFMWQQPSDYNKAPLPIKVDYVERKVSEPLAVLLAGEYDIWDKRDPNAELFQHGLRSRELTPEIWSKLLSFGGMTGDDAVEDLLFGGRAVAYFREQENASIIQGAGFDLLWEGLRFLACNAARYNSHLFTAGIKPEHDALLGFCWRGAKWTVSLYGAPGKPDVDLAKIAVKHGGGGHKQACGFTAQHLPFDIANERPKP